MTQVLSTVFYIVVAILVLLIMVTIHELGHYIAGRMLGFKIKEFAVGFGKVLWSKNNKRGEKISLRLFPLGGYCSFEGEDDLEKVEVGPDTFQAQKPWKRIVVYVAGPLFNIFSAFIFGFILLVSFGYDVPMVTKVATDNVNVQALQANDIIEKVDGVEIDFMQGTFITKLIAEKELGEDIVLSIQRNGESMEVIVQLTQSVDENEELVFDEFGNPVSYLAVNLTPARYSFLEALAKFIPFTFYLSWIVLKGLVMTLTFQIPLSNASGPIGAIGLIAQQTQASFGNLLLLLPLISVNLGIFNLLPIPALDGSHVVFTTIEWIRRKPINRTVEAYIHFFGLMALLAFVVLLDILHMVS